MKRVVGLALAVALVVGAPAQARQLPASASTQAFNGAVELVYSYPEPAGYYTYVTGNLAVCDKYPNGYRCSLRMRWKPLGRHAWKGDCSIVVVAWRSGYRLNRRQIDRCPLPTRSPRDREGASRARLSLGP